MLQTKIKDTLCIVDDDVNVLRALNRELRDFADTSGFQLKSYTSPWSCLQELEKINCEVSVIISDLRMPEMKGSAFLSRVHKEYPDIELMLLTAFQDIPEIQEAVSAAIGSLLMKPWDPEKLQKEIRKARDQYFERKNSRIHQKKLVSQLEQASDFQRKLLQTEIPSIRNAKLDVSYLPYPSMKIGGDYYDIVPLDENRFYVIIGDVTGHGIRPSMVTAILKVLSLSFYQELKEKELSPAEFLNRLNPKICQALKTSSDILITFSCLLIDTKKKIMTLSNAGHLPLFQVKSSHCIAHTVDGPALGFVPSIEYRETEIQLDKGDIIALYTDGLLESEMDRKKIRNDVVQHVFVQSYGRPDFNQKVINQLKFLRDIEDFYDDVTLISIRL